MHTKIFKFIVSDIWRVRADELSKWQSFAVRKLRMTLLAFRGFKEDKCQLRASALTFYTLLSIVPVMAMAFGVAKGFGFEKMLENTLTEQLQGQGEAITKIIQFAQQLLENTKGGIVAGVGILILFWTVIKVLGNIENSFNAIWGIKKSRTMGRKFADYLSIMLICPLLFIMSSSVTVFVTGFIASIIEKLSFLGLIGGLIVGIIKFLPYVVIWVLFSFIYIIMPNGKVNLKSGILGGIVSGTIYQLVQWAYIAFQIGVAKFNAIYGSFAALPLFLVWLQMSWLIVLFGAEIAFSHQNDKLYEFEPDCLRASFAFKRLMLVYVLTDMVERFINGEQASAAEEIAHRLGMPIRLVRELVFSLTECGLASEVYFDDDKDNGYQPAEDIDKYTISYVLDKVGYHGVSDIPVKETELLGKLRSSLSSIHSAIESSRGNVHLREL